MNAHTITRTRNPIPVDDKLRTNWDRAVRSLARADTALTDALKKAHRIAGLFEEAEPEEPEINWRIIGDRSGGDDRTRVLLQMDLDELTQRSRYQAQWTFPHPRDEAILLEVAKIREYRLRRDLLDVKLGLHATQSAVDDACDRRTSAEAKLLLTPAPDLDAVQTKLEYMFGDMETGAVGGYVQQWRRDYTDAIIADVRRLNQQATEA